MDAGNARDVDAFAIVGEPGDYGVCLLLVRGGRSLGTTSYYPRAPGTAEEVLASFLMQHYAREEAPPEVRVNLELPDALALSEALSQQQARVITVSQPTRGIAARWVEAAAGQRAAGAAHAPVTARRCGDVAAGVTGSLVTARGAAAY